MCTLPAQVVDWRFLKAETLCHVPSVCRANEWIGCCVTVLYKESCQSLIPLIVRCVWWFDFWTRKTFNLLKCIANLSKCMNKGNVCKCCHLFKGGRTDGHNEAWSGRLSVITKDLKDRVDAHIHEIRRFTTDELHEVFPYVLQTVLYETVTVQLRYRKMCARWVPNIQSVLYETVTVQLRYRKMCARWVPNKLTDEHNQLWIREMDWQPTSMTRGSSSLCNIWTNAWITMGTM
jgi:hypothetical protein